MTYASILKSVQGRLSRSAIMFFEQKTQTQNFVKNIIKNNLEKLQQNLNDQEALTKITAVIKGVVMSGDDRELKQLLQIMQNAHIIPLIADHAAILNSAIDKKLTKTFAILLQYGFDPSKKTEETLNPLAYACKTQSIFAVQSYYESIAKIIDEQKSIHLLQEVHNQKDSLNHAIEGKSFLSTVQFILQKANPNITISHLIVAGKKGHTVTFSELLQHYQLETKDLDTLKESIVSGNDFAIMEIFIDYLRKKGDSNSMLTDLIASLDENRRNLNPQDIYKICLKSGPKAFEFFLSEMQERKIAIDFNSQDSDGKTPLFYAIEENCFDKTVDLLLRNGANPNHIARDDRNLSQKSLNALELMIEHQESETLGLLLKNNNGYKIRLENPLIKQGLQTILGIKLNALLYSSFIRNIDEPTLSEISDGLGESIICQALECEFDKDLFAKIKQYCLSQNNIDFKKIMSELVKQSNHAAVAKLIEEFSVDLIDAGIKISSDKIKEDQISEATPLLKHAKTKTSYGATPTKLFMPKHQAKYGCQPKSEERKTNILDFAFEIAERSPEEERENAIKTVTILYDAGFLTERATDLSKKLQALQINPDTTTRIEAPLPSSTNISFCERIMSCLTIGTRSPNS